MHKLKLILLPVLVFMGTSIIVNASTKVSMPTFQQSVGKSNARYEYISIAANYVNGRWLVDGQQRPVIKTSMTKRNYLQIENQSAFTSLNLVIPKIAFDVIAKNGVLLSKIVSLDEEAAGKNILWLEPGSSLILSFVNDLSSTPLQAIVSVRKLNKDVIAIFGPAQDKKFTLPPSSNTQQASKEYAPAPEVALNLTVPKKLRPAAKISDYSNATLLPSHIYEIKAAEKIRSFKFSEFVWVGKRNNLVLDSNYFSNKLTVYPGETFSISTLKKTTMRADNA